MTDKISDTEVTEDTADMPHEHGADKFPATDTSRVISVIKSWLPGAAVLGFGGLAFFLLFKLAGKFWSAFNALDNSVAAAFVGGFFGLVASTITVMVARYYEEKRKRAELYREKKVQMYDEFINRLLTEFSGEELKRKIEKARAKKTEQDLGLFLRQKQKEFLLWSSAGVLREFSEWMKMLSHKHDANLLLQTEKFFLEIRKDLGHSNWSIKQGDTIRLLLRDTDFFLDAVKENPDITLSELAELEKEAKNDAGTRGDGVNDPSSKSAA